MVRMFWQQQSAIVVSLLLHVGVFALVGMNVFGDAGLLKPEPQEPIVFIDLMPSAPPILYLLRQIRHYRHPMLS